MNAHFTPALPAWLSRLIASKPTVTVQPRCTCGRFCSTKSEKKVDPVLAERLAKGQSVPAYFERAGE